jgi:hypothetical protein
VRQLLEATPLRRLPGFGGKVAETLQQAGAQSVADIQVRPPRRACGVGSIPAIATDRHRALYNRPHLRSSRVSIMNVLCRDMKRRSHRVR